MQKYLSSEETHNVAKLTAKDIYIQGLFIAHIFISKGKDGTV